MSLSTYQLDAARTVNPALSADDRLLDAAAGLAEEAGEVLARVRKHRFQQRALDRESIVTELGDALWCLAMVASSLGVTLDEVAERNLAKLRQRYPDGFSAERSRERRDAGEDPPA
ncbi:MAG: nucleoside triphosphate pyrophosphohydrolase family protein [Gemmatimonadaceae bacterium]|nr:nucleoside triphosphate pyrophosphohydrolase family protein [Gemmatimonadaceae bacterium]NUQ91784.1 nucleoside triphosphate pyrophosphohydrolase family protein [Gemmatimonadaceae bacterium]NUR18521.1 nucleoside triphosphate pyrophosphohydrolase family protein [Gemmatimonadaceae bacterium]NUS99066.1 nucleoside triphosphate pyrophosphohydrolase family protein [Gemmatimonadaceae bacterium]